MSIIIFFSASKQIIFCRNDVQAIDFLRKGSYAPDIIKDHQFYMRSGRSGQRE
jgi:hypothetical protein